MIPFNLERALAGDPVVTRDGRKVSEIYLFKTCNYYEKLVAVIDGIVKFFTIDGIYLTSPSSQDLFMAPKTKKVYLYVNKYSKNGEKRHYYTTNADTEEFDISNPDKWQYVEIDLEIVDESIRDIQDAAKESISQCVELEDVEIDDSFERQKKSAIKQYNNLLDIHNSPLKPLPKKTKKLWIAVDKKAWFGLSKQDVVGIENTLEELKCRYSESNYHLIQIEIPEE